MNEITRRIALALGLAVLAAPPVAAQEAGTSPEAAHPAPSPAGPQILSLPSGSIPARIFGIDCEARDGDSTSDPSLRCDPPDLLKTPSISAVSGPWKRQMTRAEMIALMREAFHERTMFNVIREEPFEPTADPKAVGFRALYQTDLGNRYVWALLSEGRFTRVIATVFAPADFAAMTADIEAKVFGVGVNQGNDR
ncbi:MAG TPA: hypothetical protein VF574_17935 [Allosphingosinicella sp.]|jgi:hypothetical protein